MLTLNLSAGVVFAIGVVVGAVVGVLALSVVAVVVNTKKK